MSIDLRALIESIPDRDQVLAEYREALHRGENISVDRLPVYELGKAQPVASVTVSLPVAPRITQQITPPAYPMISGVFLSGVMPINTNGLPWSEAAEDEEQRKDRMNKMGNKVLRHVNAHETSRLGELTEIIRKRMQYLKDSASFTNSQWKDFAALNEALNEMIGDPYDPESTESD